MTPAAEEMLRTFGLVHAPEAAPSMLELKLESPVEDALVAGDFYDSGEPIAACAWPLLIQVGGLARLAGPRLELSPRGRAALARPSYETLGALWARWLRSVSSFSTQRLS